ncbi:NAD(P)/FAD-dependent oxidoreductase [Virgisporangium aurantiacum]|uniref:FAD-binding domain-containing protein n=1 Tax=Virgisporangium aurantiacum TaxID=175570 RepID=A0A8J4DZ19_9ACTN|nr:NAD(P)/FAD-dependent oxidoreductase [Virgisporangium aurantiacum]GIJ55509.1 hypothetical protein Vau01_030250 [Virgisporangium aurantiacum]
MSGYDVAVVGAGPAGSATARWLARAGQRVVLLERSRFDAPRVGESLAPATNGLLRELGVWQDFTALAPVPSHGTRSVWGGPVPASNSHLVNPYGCGWHVDRLAFDRMLASAAVSAGVELRLGVACRRVERDDAGWSLSTGGGRLRARILVDATGRAASIGRRLGGRRIVFDRLVAIAAMFEGDADGYVLVETVPDGWWYSAPTPPGHALAMLMTDGDLCRPAVAPDRWQALLAGAPVTAARLAATRPQWGPRVFPAPSQRLHRVACDAPWLAVGDAALAVDPISGSGVVRALRTSRAAAEAVLAMLDGTEPSALAAYEAERDRECTTYLHERALYYGAERRWDAAPFWRRRTSVLPSRPLLVG